MTRRHFLSTAMRAVLLATLLPFLPVGVARAKWEEQPDGSMLPGPIPCNPATSSSACHAARQTARFLGSRLSSIQTVLAADGRFVCFDKSGNGNHLYSDGNPPDLWVNVKELRIYPEVHSKERRDQEVREMQEEARRRRP